MADFQSSVVVSYSLFLCCFFNTVLASQCNFNVKMKQSLLNHGFHMNLTYGIVFNADDERSRWLLKGCLVALEQMLPASVYVNPDELNDLSRMQKINAIVPNKVNIELPAEDSQPSKVYVLEKIVSSVVYLWLPVHARYHRAQPGGGTIRIGIPLPNFYLRCPDQRLNHCDKNLTLSTFLCNGSSKEKCSWRKIPYKVMSKEATHEIPVGNTDHYYIVASGTAAIVLVGALYLIHTIHKYKISTGRKKSY